MLHSSSLLIVCIEIRKELNPSSARVISSCGIPSASLFSIFFFYLEIIENELRKFLIQKKISSDYYKVVILVIIHGKYSVSLPQLLATLQLFVLSISGSPSLIHHVYTDVKMIDDSP